MPLIASSLADDVGTLCLDNPKKRNALNRALVEELLAALKDLQERRARVVVLRAEAGCKVWSAGHDVSELPKPGRDPLSYDDSLVTMLRSIQLSPFPVIAMIEGSVWGGACDLALSCDILVGAPSASFTMTPARIGVPYNASGILHFLTNLGAATTREMFFTAQPLTAERALRVGLLNHLVPEDGLEPFTYGLARKIAQNSPMSIAAIKEQIRLLTGAAPLSPAVFERINSLRQKVYESADYAEGLASFVEKRPPKFSGC